MKPSEAEVNAEDRKSAQNAAAAYLARRARTTHELTQWMERKGYSPEVMRDLVGDLRSSGLLDDAAYARRYVELRTARGYGTRRIVRELRRRGIADGLASRAAAEANDEAAEAEAIQTLAIQRNDRLRSEPDVRKRKKKIFDFLIRRGYAPETVRKVIDTLNHG